MAGEEIRRACRLAVGSGFALESGPTRFRGWDTRMLTVDYVLVATLVFIVVCNVYFAPRIRRDRVAMQWGLDGKPTWHAPKWLALWGVVLFMLVVRLIIWASMTYAPALVHDPEVALALFPIIVAAAHVFVLTRAAKAS